MVARRDRKSTGEQFDGRSDSPGRLHRRRAHRQRLGRALSRARSRCGRLGPVGERRAGHARPCRERLAGADAGGLEAGRRPSRPAQFVKTVAEAVREADFIQESAPENIAVKRKLHAEIDAHARPDGIVASSSSGLLPSRDAGRLQASGAAGHRPSVQSGLSAAAGRGAGRQEDLARACARAARFYETVSMRPLMVKKEIEGYVADRLQEAMWREALHLVNDGVATTPTSTTRSVSARGCAGPSWARC